MKFALKLEVTEESSSTIVRNIHESFRMLGDALLIAKGIEPQDHLQSVKELLKTKVETSRPLNTIDNLRRLRNIISYYGYRPKINEVQNAISIAKSCFKPLAIKIKKDLTN
ncbi:hypothetical protein JW868_00745 [Candidatus Woesearchaeota archaeon]|nr:hypothetical protein [Candidatus Woesearchaeota archaeon]